MNFTSRVTRNALVQRKQALLNLKRRQSIKGLDSNGFGRAILIQNISIDVLKQSRTRRNGITTIKMEGNWFQNPVEITPKVGDHFRTHVSSSLWERPKLDGCYSPVVGGGKHMDLTLQFSIVPEKLRFNIKSFLKDCKIVILLAICSQRFVEFLTTIKIYKIDLILAKVISKELKKKKIIYVS